MDAFHVRAAREDDLERLVEIHACAYPDGGGYDHHERKFTHASFGGLANFRVVESGSRVVGHAALYPLEVWVGGRKVPVGGIASVGVAPEVRGRGVAHALLERMHREIEEQNAALALLYPFREGFYQELGYATTAPFISLRVAAVSLAGAFAAHRADLAGFSVVPLEGALVGQAKALYEEVAKSGSGAVARTEARWMRLFARESRHWLAVTDGDRLEGYLSMSYEAPVANARQSLVVHELIARSQAARHALILVLGRQRDQVDDVELTVPLGDPLPFVLADASGWRRGDARKAHPLGSVAAGPMVRVADVGRALAARGYARDGELTVRAADPRLAETVRLAAWGGRAETEPSSGVPDIELPRPLLGSLIAGGLRPSEAADLGILRGHPAAVRLADELFSGPRFRCLDPF
jgi:predicted acetyltransferase